MHNDSRNLMAAVARAIDHTLDVNSFDDRLTMQRGCYILNCWGVGPTYRYSLYIRGPYSSDLADEYYEFGNRVGETTTVPDEYVDRLAGIFQKGTGYAEAYATVLLVKNNSPHTSHKDITNKALELKPHLKAEVLEASERLLT